MHVSFFLWHPTIFWNSGPHKLLHPIHTPPITRPFHSSKHFSSRNRSRESMYGSNVLLKNWACTQSPRVGLSTRIPVLCWNNQPRLKTITDGRVHHMWTDWQMESHLQECSVFYLSRPRIPKYKPYTLHDHLLVINKTLTWNGHIDSVTKASHSSLAFLEISKLANNT